jgi:pimeloyl-ACP methyl ester carboxylesterase
MPHLDANDLSFHVLRLPERPSPDGGSRPKVVMLHGLILGTLASFYFTMANQVALIADTYLYDMRGHGRTDVPDSGYRVADHLADLQALLAAWKIDEPVHLVGNSFGGVIALAFAHQFPERVASMVLIEAIYPTEGWGEHAAGSLALASFGLDEQRTKDWLARHGTRKLHSLARRSEHLFLRTSMIDDLQRERPIPHRALEAITCPTLAIYGEGSDIIDRAHDLQRHVPRCELRIVPDCAHSVLEEAAPFVRDQTVSWLRERTAERSPTPAAGG